MKKIYITALLGISCFAFSQTYPGKVGINTDTPAATLDMNIAAGNTTTAEGLLVPRITTARAEAMGTNPKEATLVYITDGTAGTTTGTAISGKGFYYYDTATNKWTTMKGSGGSGGSSNLAPATGKLRTLANITSTEWLADDFTIVITDGSVNLALPNPAAPNVNRILTVRNGSTASKSFTGSYTPTNNATLGLNRGVILQSDGTQWWVIGGF